MFDDIEDVDEIFGLDIKKVRKKLLPSNNFDKIAGNAGDTGEIVGQYLNIGLSDP